MASHDSRLNDIAPSSFAGQFSKRPRAARAARLALLLAGLCGAASFAALALPDAPPAAPAAPADAPPAAAPEQTFLLDQASHVRDDLAAMLERRPDASPTQAPAADAAIDLRIVAGRLLDESAHDAADNDLAACAYLRAGDLLFAAAALDPRLAAPSPAQLAALGKLHQMTYKLPAITTAAQMDGLSAQIEALLQAGGGGPEAQTRGLPLMRPETGQAVSTTAGKSLEDLTTAARQAAVSPTLRRQLMLLTTAAASGKSADDSADAYDVLSRVIDLTRGLAHGGPDESQARASVEAQLADGVALFLDVRTRAAGKEKVEQLGRYRQMLDEVRALNVAPAVQNKLTPAYLWAQKNPQAGATLLDTAPAYLQTCARYDAAKPVALPAPQQRAVEQMRRQFDSQRQGYLTDAAALVDPANGGPSGDFAKRLATMNDIEQALELIDKMPADIAVLNRYKPRPMGGLERGVLVFISSIGGAIQNPKPENARRYLISLDRLSKLAGEVVNVSQVPAEIDKTYARNRLSQLDRRRGEMLLELIGQVASGRDISKGLDQLEALKSLADALPEAAAAEGALKTAEAQSSWEDWQPPAEALAGVLHDYREATAATFDAVTSGDAAAPARWAPIHHRIEPILALLISAGGYADRSSRLPTGWPEALARLATPLDHQPFVGERYASLMLAVWKQAAAAPAPDPTAAANPDAPPAPADVVLEKLSAGLRKMPKP